ncbi:MAG: penicillin-insensitive murein endopeptidase [Polyangiaceae bacterium]|jgi:penicillin-insensitive murein endopeptidase|nr:penicillin-insensitive murein endopeptidase [Polyangiaceae bacterium]
MSKALVVSTMLLASSNVGSAPPAAAPVAPALLRSAATLSVGAPNAGQLIDGVQLSPTNVVRVLPAWSGPGFQWGLPELVNMIHRAAASVAQRFPPATLSVGDLSGHRGGAIREHLSHQSGRDVDVAFFMVDSDDRPILDDDFVSFNLEGKSDVLPGARFDDTRNWALVQAVLSDREARVLAIFVSNDLKQRLLAEAVRVGAPLALRRRAGRFMVEPTGSTPHDNHFHIRIACPARQLGICEDLPRRPDATRRPSRTRRPEAKLYRVRAGSASSTI